MLLASMFPTTGRPEELSCPGTGGVLRIKEVLQPASSSDAAAKGIEEGDILLSVNGTNVTTMDALNGAVYNLDVGDTVEVVIYRSGKQYRVSLTVTEDKG